MSGATSSGLATVAKLVVALFVVLAIEYVAVLVQLVQHADMLLTWKIVIVLFTPVLVVVALLISRLKNNKTINMVAVVMLTYLNLVYLLIPVNTTAAIWLYGGSNAFAAMSLMVLISVLTTFLLLFAFIVVLFFILKAIG